MAKNRKRHQGRKLWLNVSAINGSGAGDLVKSGDPGMVGDMPVVATTDEDADGMASCDSAGVYELTVEGHDGTAAAAIGQGDALAWDNTLGRLRKKVAATKHYGYAVEAVASGVTDTTVLVKVGF